MSYSGHPDRHEHQLRRLRLLPVHMTFAQRIDREIQLFSLTVASNSSFTIDLHNVLNNIGRFCMKMAKMRQCVQTIQRR